MNEESQNQESFSSAEVNDFHSSLSARDYEASNQSQSTEETATTSTSVPLSAGVLTTGVVGVTTATIGILIARPIVNALPKIENLETLTTSSSVSYSFQCAYSGAGKLVVRLTSAFDEKNAEYSLEAEEASSLSSASSEALSSASSSASSTYSKTIQGSFAELLPQTSYAISVLSPLTENTFTTLKSASFTTSASTEADLSFVSSAIDSEKQTLAYEVKLDDPSSLLLTDSFEFQIDGLDLTNGSAKSVTSPLDSSLKGSVSLASFKGGQSLTYALYAKKQADSSREKFEEKSAYYAGVKPVVSFLSDTADYTNNQALYQLNITDPCGFLEATSFEIRVSGYDSNGASVSAKETLTGSLTDGQSISLASFTKGNFLRLSIWGISSYAKEGDSALKSQQKFVEKALYY